MTTLPGALSSIIHTTLSSLGDPGPIVQIQILGGGCINHASRIMTQNKSYFLKWNQHPYPNMFSMEAYGLNMLASINTVRVPKVIKVQESVFDVPAFILLEWIERQSTFDQRKCGQQLALLHLKSNAEQFGLEYDNFIGSTPQNNNWHSDWITFFREERLKPQIDLAQKNGLCGQSRRLKLDKLMTQLEKWLAGVERKTSLLHGDLWGGNVIGDQNGNPVLIDPAVYYGDREADVAFTQMFGGFSRDFYQAYMEAYPLESGYQDRFEIYNVYHLLNHLNLFGESYGHSLDTTLRRWVG